MNRRSLALFGACAFAAGVTACSSANPATPSATRANAAASSADGANAAADGSTLKATPAGAVSPVNDLKFNSPVVTLTARPATLLFPTPTPVALQYRFQVFNPANVVVVDALVSETTYQVTATLPPNTRHTWRVRAELQGGGGPWSSTASFITEDPAIINDPLTNGTTVGTQIGGRFLPGQGWQSGSVTNGIEYDLPSGCVDCTLVFDATNFGGQEGLPFQKDLKWVSMGDPAAWGGFGAFRDHPWKMHLVQRADYPTGMEIIWRNGANNPNGDPGDHRIKLLSTPINFSSSQFYHFQLDWGRSGYAIFVNGVLVLADGWNHPYDLAPLRIELGCIPRAESFIGIIYSNVRLTKH